MPNYNRGRYFLEREAIKDKEMRDFWASAGLCAMVLVFIGLSALFK